MKPRPDAHRESELPEIVLVSVGEIGSGALEAHAGELARRLSRHATVHWGALVSPRLFLGSNGRAILGEFRRGATASLSGRLVVLPHGPRFAGTGITGRALGWRLRQAGVGEGAILHARGYLATLAALSAKPALPGALVLHDVRGDRPAEVRIHGGERSPERLAELEGIACRGADAHLAVSHPLADVLRRRHGVRSAVFPCAADCDAFRPDPAGRARIRRELGFGDEFVLGFVGSCAGWQQPSALVALFSRLRVVRPSARLLVLSPDVAAWARELEGHGLEPDIPGAARPHASVFVRAARRSDVPAWFSACDATALLRADDDVNRVASPIKFGESLACGVPVFLNENLGDASSLVASRGLGACFHDAWLRGDGDQALLEASLERIEREPGIIAAACRATALEEWSWDSQIQGRLEVYRLMAAGRPVVACDETRPERPPMLASTEILP